VRLLLSNLLDNAAKYATAERVAISLSAHMDAATTYLTFSDDGPGLGTLAPRSVFEDFQRGTSKACAAPGSACRSARW